VQISLIKNIITGYCLLKEWAAHVKFIPAKREKIITLKNEKSKYLDLLN
jgi:hypothetical protein